MKDKTDKKKYIDRASYLEWQNINYQIDLEEKELKEKQTMLRINDLTVRYYRSESERFNYLANITHSQKKCIEDEIDQCKNKIKDKKIKLEEFVDNLKKNKNIELKDHLINPKTLELKPVLITK